MISTEREADAACEVTSQPFLEVVTTLIVLVDWLSMVRQVVEHIIHSVVFSLLTIRCSSLTRSLALPYESHSIASLWFFDIALCFAADDDDDDDSSMGEPERQQSAFQQPATMGSSGGNQGAAAALRARLNGATAGASEGLILLHNRLSIHVYTYLNKCVYIYM